MRSMIDQWLPRWWVFVSQDGQWWNGDKNTSGAHPRWTAHKPWGRYGPVGGQSTPWSIMSTNNLIFYTQERQPNAESEPDTGEPSRISDEANDAPAIRLSDDLVGQWAIVTYGWDSRPYIGMPRTCGFICQISGVYKLLRLIQPTCR